MAKLAPALARVVVVLAALSVAGSSEARPHRAPSRNHAHDAARNTARHAARHKKSLVTFSPSYASAPSYRYASLSKEACVAELDRRAIRYVAVDVAKGVLAPVRLPEGVGGVRYRTELPESERATSPWEVFDCRLVLALHDFGAVLAEHGIAEAIIFSAWRPPGKRWPDDKLATRHPGALALDVKALKLRESGDWLSVKADFAGRVGDVTCGPNAAPPVAPSARAATLRKLVCTAAAAHTFTSILTPNYDAAHHDHLHLEVTPEVKWQLVR